MRTHDHQEIERGAQEKWAALRLHETNLEDDSKPPYYLLSEFPYPSGDLHIGHWFAFAVTDIFARVKRMKGANVLFPIGFDAFGLPAENAAIKNKLDPKEWTYKNMERMRGQLKSMGASFDWSKEVVTCEPEYYKWTQWLFLKLMQHGLAYRALAAVKWCPKDKTVLANEQVIDGHCERCGTEVEEKKLTQWFLKITEYAERLLKDLEPLPWREEIKDAQRAWIGRSEGARIRFKVQGSNDETKTLPLTPDTGIEVFTTRPDTIFGATYVVLAPEHPLVSKLSEAVSNKKEVEKYVSDTKKKTERERSENKEKTGVKLAGVSAINPASQEEVPIFVADYVLGSYGTGAVMAVPAHDERDFEFAKKFNLPIRQVVEGEGSPYTGTGVLLNSGDFTGKNSDEVLGDIVTLAGGKKTTNYRIRDWLVSRQRYWGCPIPVVYDPEGQPHPVPAEHLPWLLPTDVDFTPSGESPLATSKELKERVEKLFGKGWTPEYDTLDVFIDSSWYYARYLDSKNERAFADPALLKKWLPVNRYTGGAEHTTVHLLYSRFFYKALFDLALVPSTEPYIERFNRGIILGPDGAKMSKSKGNVINPDEFVQKYGADAVRLYLGFIGPYNEPGSYPWNLDGVAAMRKFIDRVVRMVEKAEGEGDSLSLAVPLARAIAKVGEDSEKFKFNTAIAALMTLLNELESTPVPRSAAKTFVTLLAPFAPHFAEELWAELGGEGSVHQAPWPVADEAVLTTTSNEVTVQVNGKRRGSISLPPGAEEAEALVEALKLPAVLGALGDAPPKRVVYVPGRVLNLVA